MYSSDWYRSCRATLVAHPPASKDRCIAGAFSFQLGIHNQVNDSGWTAELRGAVVPGAVTAVASTTLAWCTGQQQRTRSMPSMQTTGSLRGRGILLRQIRWFDHCAPVNHTAGRSGYGCSTLKACALRVTECFAGSVRALFKTAQQQRLPLIWRTALVVRNMIKQHSRAATPSSRNIRCRRTAQP